MNEVKNRKKETSNNFFDALAVLDKPLEIEGRHVYGVLYNIEQEKRFKTCGKGMIDEYIWFCKGVEQWQKNGGHIKDECCVWTLGDNKPKFTCDVALQYVVIQLMKGLVSISKYEFDHPLEWDESEVDDSEPRIVISQALIDRYTKDIKNDTQNKQIEV